MTDQWCLVVAIRRPLPWQAFSEAIYGPMSHVELDALVQSIPQANIHRLSAYPLRSPGTLRIEKGHG